MAINVGSKLTSAASEIGSAKTKLMEAKSALDTNITSFATALKGNFAIGDENGERTILVGLLNEQFGNMYKNLISGSNKLLGDLKLAYNTVAASLGYPKYNGDTDIGTPQEITFEISDSVNELSGIDIPGVQAALDSLKKNCEAVMNTMKELPGRISFYDTNGTFIEAYSTRANKFIENQQTALDLVYTVVKEKLDAKQAELEAALASAAQAISEAFNDGSDVDHDIFALDPKQQTKYGGAWCGPDVHIPIPDIPGGQKIPADFPVKFQ